MFDIQNYLEQIYASRGWDFEEIQANDWFPLQLSNWKRLVARHNLSSNERMADDLLFEFSTIPVGKPERLYEIFAEFLGKRPKALYQAQEDQKIDSQTVRSCSYCDGIGVVMYPVLHKSGLVHQCAFKCRCFNSEVYLGVPSASQSQLMHAKRQRDYQEVKRKAWLRSLGCDPDTQSEESMAAVAREKLKNWSGFLNKNTSRKEEPETANVDAW